MVHFDAAPWPTSLKVTSLVGTLLLVVVGYFAVEAIPHGTRVPFAEAFGTLIAAVLPLVAVIAALFVVRGYDLGAQELRIQRLLWSTRIGLAGLTGATQDPSLMRGSLRVFGNGGLYSYTGFFQNRAIGRYRAFVTDPKNAVVLRLPDRTVVVSPAKPQAFVGHLHVLFPGLQPSAPQGTA